MGSEVELSREASLQESERVMEESEDLELKRDVKIEGEERGELDEETLETLRQLHHELELEDELGEEVAWEDIKVTQDPVDLFFERLSMIKDIIVKKFRKEDQFQETFQGWDHVPKAGDEIVRELEDAWNLYTRGVEAIPSRSVGYVLRILGQNPTEDEIVDMVMKANCDWEGLMSRSDFVNVAVEIIKGSCDQMDDVKAAFRVFDHNNDGSISKEELKEAMVNFGTRCTDEEFATMFAEADQNNDGLIDFDEFVAMMLPSTAGAEVSGVMGST